MIHIHKPIALEFLFRDSGTIQGFVRQDKLGKVGLKGQSRDIYSRQLLSSKGEISGLSGASILRRVKLGLWATFRVPGYPQDSCADGRGFRTNTRIFAPHGKF